MSEQILHPGLSKAEALETEDGLLLTWGDGQQEPVFQLLYKAKNAPENFNEQMSQAYEQAKTALN